ncbi:MAG: hypothetical protein ACI4QB_07040, partial [Eubacteriales bacterium]
MNSEPEKRKASPARQFWEDRGFYLVLLLCVAAIGVAGYVFFFADTDPSGTVAYTTAGDPAAVLEPWATGGLPALTTTAGIEPAFGGVSSQTGTSAPQTTAQTTTGTTAATVGPTPRKEARIEESRPITAPEPIPA